MGTTRRDISRFVRHLRDFRAGEVSRSCLLSLLSSMGVKDLTGLLAKARHTDSVTKLKRLLKSGC